MKKNILTFTLVILSQLAISQNNKSFTFAAVGDIQYENHIEQSYAARTIFSELSNNNDCEFAMILGDIVHDNPQDLDNARQLLDLINMPYRPLIGNHDRDAVVGDWEHTYRKVFGSPTYSFEHKNATFICLNNIFSTGKYGYKGIYNDEGLELVKKTIKTANPEQLIIICQHIPTYSCENREELLDLLDDRENVLILSAHTHTVRKFIHRGNICELTVGAPCGFFWTGERETDLIPYSLQWCGSPRNYFEVDILNNGEYNFRYKGIGLDSDIQSSLWIKGEELLDYENPAFQADSTGLLLANIFGACDSTTVEVRINDGEEWIKMEKVKRTDPMVARLAYLNELKIHPTKHCKRSPYRKSSSSNHLWQLQIKETRNPIIKIELRAKDSFGLSFTQTFIKSISRI